MILAFTLSMPGSPSWNGKWSGEGRKYVITRTFRPTRSLSVETANRILEKGYFGYSFGDGWRAGVDVTLVDAKQAAKLRKESSGFCGYDWMVDSIIQHNEILGK